MEINRNMEEKLLFGNNPEDKEKIQSPFSFFICHFHPERGTVVLAAYPPHLAKDKKELSILKAHPVWRLDETSGHLDLKIMGKIYRSISIEKFIENIQEHSSYYLIVKGPKDFEFKIDILLSQFSNKIKQNFSSVFELLVKEVILSPHQKKLIKYKKIVKEAKIIRQRLLTEWEKIILELDTLTKESLPDKGIEPKKMNRSPKDQKSLDQKNLLLIRRKKPITIKLSPSKNPDKMIVSLTNTSEHINDCTITVSLVNDLFSSLLWERKITNWGKGQQIILEVDRKEVDQIYLIQVKRRSRKTQLTITVPKKS